MSENTWQVYDLAELQARVAGHEPRFVEFLRVPKLSCAIYRLPAGSRDMQAPHLEDEIYIVMEGHARLRVGSQHQEVGPGKVLFIGANADHCFTEISEDLTVIAVFGARAKPWKE